jgi:hypothetical protein
MSPIDKPIDPSRMHRFLIDDANITSPLCHSCRYWINDTLTCAAFPEGIPIPVLTNEWDHRHPLDGDHGIQYAALTEDNSRE